MMTLSNIKNNFNMNDMSTRYSEEFKIRFTAENDAMLLYEIKDRKRKEMLLHALQFQRYVYDILTWSGSQKTQAWYEILGAHAQNQFHAAILRWRVLRVFACGFI